MLNIKACPLTWSWASSVHLSSQSFFLKIHLNVISSPPSESSKWLLLRRFSYQSFVCCCYGQLPSDSLNIVSVGMCLLSRYQAMLVSSRDRYIVAVLYVTIYKQGFCKVYSKLNCHICIENLGMWIIVHQLLLWETALTVMSEE
jgi:hypothetical protein